LSGEPAALSGCLSLDTDWPVSLGSGSDGFTFNRLGVRLQAIAISPWIYERTVVNDVHHHTSVIRTMRERWKLGKPFTGRDADAPDLAPLLTRDTPQHGSIGTQIPNMDDLTGAEGLAIVHETVGHLFPGLRRTG
jgi:hypothetical protein